MSVNSPLVYIIVLTWNGREHTLECIRSLYQSDYPNYRVLLVDNASSDNTVAAVRQEFSEIELIENSSNFGYAEGNNIGIRHAIRKGAMFLFVLNNDTIVDPHAITCLVYAAGQDDSSIIYCPFIYNYFSPDELVFQGNTLGPGKFQFRPLERESENGSFQQTNMIPTGFAPGCSLFLGRGVIQDVGLFDSRFFIMWEDADWCARAICKGFKIFVVPSAKIWHKESRSFHDVTSLLTYHYYYHRNHLLWIEKNLRGFSRLRAILRTFKRLLRPLLLGPNLRERLVLVRVRLLGLWHYLIRRFGPMQGMPKS